jgi:phthalate 4,5-cis-dihydrodiol dehydrogenase
LTSDSTDTSPVRLGVVGLGRAFVLTLPAFRADPRIRLAAACDPRPAARAAFEREFGGRTYEAVEDLCSDPAVEAVYIASPHELHCAHVLAAAAAGKHVLVEKPLAVSLEDGARMVATCAAAGVHLLVGPSHSFDAPVQLARGLIDSGVLGRVRMIHAFNYTDFLYRPRRPEELDTGRGGGVIFSQGVHQIDIVRLLAGGRARQVFAMTGAWDPERPTEGAYSALLSFDEAFACLTYSGYAHFDSDEWMDWRGELGNAKRPGAYGAARRALREMSDPAEELRLKAARTYGAGDGSPEAIGYEHFGPVIVSCDRADLRLTPQGIHVYGDTELRFEPAAAFRFPRAELTDALFLALRRGRPPVQTGAWGLASLEVCHALLAAARSNAPVELKYQTGLGEPK